ncbi:hypothetical protein LZA78_12025, partial [Sinirhodobacter sp. WL0062]
PVAASAASVRGYLRITAKLRKALFQKSQTFLTQSLKSPCFVGPTQLNKISPQSPPRTRRKNLA